MFAAQFTIRILLITLLSVAALLIPVEIRAAADSSLINTASWPREIVVAVLGYVDRTVSSVAVIIKDLFSSAGLMESPSIHKNIVGNSQTILLWSLSVIMIIGFVLLSLYKSLGINHELAIAKKSSPSWRDSALFKSVKFLSIMLLFSLIGVGSVYRVTAQQEAAGVVLVANRQQVLSATAIQTSTQKNKTGFSTEAKSSFSSLLVSSPHPHIVIADTPVGFLRVRERPEGKEITKVSPGESFTLIQEENGWVQIELDDTTKTLGWVAKEYVR